MSDDPGPLSANLDEWLKQRRSRVERLDIDDQEAFPPTLDLDELLPSDTSVEAIRLELAKFVQGQEEQLRQM